MGHAEPNLTPRRPRSTGFSLMSARFWKTSTCISSRCIIRHSGMLQLLTPFFPKLLNGIGTRPALLPTTAGGPLNPPNTLRELSLQQRLNAPSGKCCPNFYSRFREAAHNRPCGVVTGLPATQPFPKTIKCLPGFLLRGGRCNCSTARHPKGWEGGQTRV